MMNTDSRILFWAIVIYAVAAVVLGVERFATTWNVLVLLLLFRAGNVPRRTR